MGDAVNLYMDAKILKEEFLKDFKKLTEKYIGSKILCKSEKGVSVGKVDAIVFDTFITEEDIKFVINCDGCFCEE